MEVVKAVTVITLMAALAIWIIAGYVQLFIMIWQDTKERE